MLRREPSFNTLVSCFTFANGSNQMGAGLATPKLFRSVRLVLHLLFPFNQSVVLERNLRIMGKAMK